MPRRDVGKIGGSGDRLRFTSTGTDPQLVLASAAEAIGFGRKIEVAMLIVSVLVVATLTAAATFGGLGAVLRFAFAIGITAGGVVAIGGFALNRSREASVPYRDESGDYDLSFLDHGGRRISETYGPLGVAFDPLTVYRNLPGQRTDVFTIGPNGLRGEPMVGRGFFDVPGPRALVRGGSAAVADGLRSDAEAFPALLGERGLGHAFGNAGVVGYVSGQELALWVHYLDALNPRLVILFDGWNDLLEVQDPLLGVNSAYFTLSRRLANYHRSIVGEDPPFRPVRDSGATGSDPPRSDGGDLVQASLPPSAGSPVDLYVANVNKMHTWARARGARFVAVLQPSIFSKDRRIGEEPSIAMPEEVGKQYLEFCRDARLALEVAGVECHDANEQPEFRDSSEELFLDPVHLTPAGHRAAASMIERFLGEAR